MSCRVPELARDTTHPLLGTDSSCGNNGAFHVESPEPGWKLALICSDGTDDDPALTPEMKAWEHVSVHAYRPGSQQPEGFTLASSDAHADMERNGLREATLLGRRRRRDPVPPA
jgi:hypothetical protein